MNEQTELLREAVELLRLIAEPYIAKRDEKLRNSLYDIVGKSGARIKAVSLMDGNRTQAERRKEAAIDQGGLSRLTSALKMAGLVANSDKPKLAITLPPNFPERPE